ncbi:MAG TPA: DUF4395 domain-containing protein [Campylobacterales bacterium]|nr:DUF4395 domain-containing protein [Campylobacterales bacterium]
MNQACPISLQRVDTHFVRIIALQVVVIAMLLAITQELIFAYVLLFDFTVRLAKRKHLSPFAHIAQRSIQLLDIHPKLCDEAPKRFALYVGLVTIALATLSYLVGWTEFASVIVAVLILCASLEAAFDYCVGCKVYHLLQYLKIKR